MPEGWEPADALHQGPQAVGGASWLLEMGLPRCLRPPRTLAHGKVASTPTQRGFIARVAKWSVTRVLVSYWGPGPDRAGPWLRVGSAGCVGEPREEKQEPGLPCNPAWV